MNVERLVWVGVKSIWMATDVCVSRQERVWRFLLGQFNV